MAKKIIYTIVLLVLLRFNLSAQQIPWDDLQKVNDVFLTSNTYLIKSKYTMYKDNAVNPVESFDAIVKKKGDKMYYKLGETEIIISDKKVLLIQHDSKLATISNSSTVDADNFSPQAIKTKIDFLKKTSNIIKHNVELNNTASFKYYMPGNNTPVFELHYNKTTYLMTKIVFNKNVNNTSNGVKTTQKYRLVIDYNSIDLTGKNVIPADFDIEKYIVKTDGKYVLKPNYKTYKLIAN